MTTLTSSISRFALARRSSRHPKINTLLTRNLHPLSTIPAIATTNNSAVRSLYNEHVSNHNKNDIIDKDGYLQFNTLHEMISNATSAYDIYPLFGTYNNSTFNWMTYSEFATNVKLCRSVLKHQLGVQPYSKVGIISNNRHEWATIAAATYSLNATLVPMYEAHYPKIAGHIYSMIRDVLHSSVQLRISI